MHSTWDVEDELDEEEEADKVAVADVFQRTPFANHMQGRGGRGNNRGIPIAPGGAGIVGQTATQAVAFSNLTNAFANWNVCYTCGFDIKDGHKLVTCPRG